jgi:hypothetical protein
MDERNINHLGNGAINDGDCAWTKLRRSRHRPNAVADQQSIAKCLQNKCKLSRRSPVRTVQQSGPRRDDRNPSMATEHSCRRRRKERGRGRSIRLSTDEAATTGPVRRTEPPRRGLFDGSGRWEFFVRPAGCFGSLSHGRASSSRCHFPA